MCLLLDVRSDRRHDAVLLHLGKDLRGRRRHHGLDGSNIGDVGGDGDIVVPSAATKSVLVKVSPPPRFERRLFRRPLRLSSASAPDTDLELRIAATLRRESSLPYASRMSMRSVFFATTLRPSVTWKVTR